MSIASTEPLSAGTLFVVATPIGNLADAGARALEILRAADLLACEDTRNTQVLLARHAIRKRMVPLHEHNERATARRLVGELRSGRTVALVSDAGTPGISDPGALLVAQAHAAGVRVTPVPGPSAALAALSASGFPAARFFFAGFLPPTATGRRKTLRELQRPYPVVLYEAPHRITESIGDLLTEFGPEREIVIARELTKKFEEVVRLPLGQAPDWLGGAPHRRQGEFVLVLAPGEAQPESLEQAERTLKVLLEALAPAEAAALAARITGLPRRLLYQKALQSRNKIR